MKFDETKFREAYGSSFGFFFRIYIKTLFYISIICFAQYLKTGNVGPCMKNISTVMVIAFLMIVSPVYMFLSERARVQCMDTMLWTHNKTLYVITPICMMKGAPRKLFDYQKKQYKISNIYDVKKSMRYIHIFGDVQSKENNEWISYGNKEMKIPIAFSNMSLRFIHIKDNLTERPIGIDN